MLFFVINFAQNKLIIYKMKAFKFFLVAIIATLTLGFVSCSDDDKDEPSTSDIVGTWKLSEVSTDNSTYIAWPYKTTTATFNSNGTYSGYGYFGNGSGTWKQKGKTITTYVDGEEFIKYDVITLSTSTCTLKMSMTGSSSVLYIKCIKQ